MRDFVSNEEIIQEARRRLEQGAWDYLVGGSESETTLRRNRLAYDKVAFRPRILVDVSKVEARYAERTYDRFVAEGNILPRAGELDDEAVAAVIAGLIQDGDLAAAPRREEYRDDSFLAEALR